jgi:transcription termination factor NusB
MTTSLEGPELDQVWHVVNASGDMARYSAPDLFLSLAEGKISLEDKVWTDGMEEWVPLKELDSKKLEALHSASNQAPELSRMRFVQNSTPPKQNLRVRKEVKKQKVSFSKPALIKVGAVLLGVVATFATYQHLARFKVPVLVDVFAEEYAALESVLSQSGERTAVAISTKDPSMPTFHVASPVEDGRQVEVILYGVEGKIIGRPRMILKQVVSVSKGYAKTQPFSYLDSPIPIGEYSVYSRVLAKRAIASTAVERLYQMASDKASMDQQLQESGYAHSAYFLGGKRDSEYRSVLKKYIDHQKKEMQFEKSELKSILAKQKKYFKLMEGITMGSVPASRAESTEYVAIKRQIETAQEAWLPSTIINEYLDVVAYSHSSNLNKIVLKWSESLNGLKSGTLSKEEVRLEFSKTKQDFLESAKQVETRI